MKRKLFTALLIASLIILTGVWSHSAQAAISIAERDALIDFYNSTNGDSWADNSGWKTEPLHTDGFAMPGAEGDWYGVVVEEVDLLDHVVELMLSNNNLNGSIPASIGNLTSSRVTLHQ